MILDPYLIPYTITKLKWIKNLNIRPETIKLLPKNIRVRSLTSVMVMIFLIGQQK